MLRLRETHTSPGEHKSHVQAVLEIAVQLQKRKVVTSPNDLVGIMFYNTVSGECCPYGMLYQRGDRIAAVPALRNEKGRRNQEPLLRLPAYRADQRGEYTAALRSFAWQVLFCIWRLGRGVDALLLER